MGYIKTFNRNGRLVYACEVSAQGCEATGCRARRCPFNWCQPYYVCGSCWRKKEVRDLFSANAHRAQGCEKYVQMVARGENPFEKHIQFKDVQTGQVGTLTEITQKT